MAFSKTKLSSLLAVALLAGVLILSPSARAETVDMTASCSNTNGKEGDPASCNTYSDIKIDGSRLGKVELLGATFDDSGEVKITSPSGKLGSIPSVGTGCLQNHAYEDVTELFVEKGVYTVHVEPKNDCGDNISASANFRVTYLEELCSRPTSPKCDTPGTCQTGPGKCVAVDGKETCQYSLSGESCDADGNSCTFDACTANADGTASCKAGSNVCGGLIPCGRLANDPATPIDETKDCGFCSLVYMSSNVVNFLMGLVALITILFLVIGGFIYVKTNGNAGLIQSAKQNFAAILQGFGVIFTAWLFVNLLMIIFGFTDPLGDGRWAKVDCNLDPVVATKATSTTSAFPTTPAAAPLPTPTPTTATATATPAATTTASEDCTVGSFDTMFLCLLNKHRVESGKSPVAYEGALSQAALNHSRWMSNTGIFDHTETKDTATPSPWDRCESTGTTCDAENIAWNSAGYSGYDGALSLFTQWKNSPGHNANMLGDHTVTGLGIYNGYATSNFR